MTARQNVLLAASALVAFVAIATLGGLTKPLDNWLKANLGIDRQKRYDQRFIDELTRPEAPQ